MYAVSFCLAFMKVSSCHSWSSTGIVEEYRHLNFHNMSIFCGISHGERRPMGVVLALSDGGLLPCVEERWVYYARASLKNTKWWKRKDCEWTRLKHSESPVQFSAERTVKTFLTDLILIKWKEWQESEEKIKEMQLKRKPVAALASSLLALIHSPLHCWGGRGGTWICSQSWLTTLWDQGISTRAHQDQHYAKPYNECWITNMEPSRMSLHTRCRSKQGVTWTWAVNFILFRLNPEHQAGVWRKPCTPCFSIWAPGVFLGDCHGKQQQDRVGFSGLRP